MNFKSLNIGQGKVFIIAELSANHGSNLETAKETIRAAKRAGADAIKLQTYTADTTTINCDNEDFIIQGGTNWDGRKLYDLYDEAHTPWEWHLELFECAKKEGILCFSSPFDKKAVDFLEELKTPLYKIASFEITDIPLIEYVASKGKPIILSTGISKIDDIELAIDACHRMGNKEIAILKCTSSYPAPIDEANMRMIPDLKSRFGVISGLSDHTMGSVVPVVATSLGAEIIEKHFILDRSVGGPDASFSMTEVEFKEMVKMIRDASSALGNVDYNLTEKQKRGRNFSRSLYIVKDIKKGDSFSHENIRSIRPGFGAHPKLLNHFIGECSNTDIKAGTRLSLEMILNKNI